MLKISKVPVWLECYLKSCIPSQFHVIRAQLPPSGEETVVVKITLWQLFQRIRKIEYSPFEENVRELQVEIEDWLKRVMVKDNLFINPEDCDN
ncbi:hypothetical protein TNCV_754101 [Trichonephila clavipes]|nr:hypothetical protein TNCV_754101 [Trichonephila clavipes]